MHGEMELRVISILMVLYAVSCYDVAYRITVDGEQQVPILILEGRRRRGTRLVTDW